MECRFAEPTVVVAEIGAVIFEEPRRILIKITNTINVVVCGISQAFLPMILVKWQLVLIPGDHQIDVQPGCCESLLALTLKKT